MEGGEATAWPALMGMGGGFGAADPADLISSGAAGWRAGCLQAGAGACRTGQRGNRLRSVTAIKERRTWEMSVNNLFLTGNKVGAVS